MLLSHLTLYLHSGGRPGRLWDKRAGHKVLHIIRIITATARLKCKFKKKKIQRSTRWLTR